MPEVTAQPQNFQLNGNHIINSYNSRAQGTDNEGNASLYFTPRKTFNIVKKMNVPDQFVDVWGNV